MTTLDYADWIPKKKVAAVLDLSTKGIERLVRAKKLQQAPRLVLVEGEKVAVYHPDDVRRLALERNPEAATFVLPASHEVPRNGHGDLEAITRGPGAADDGLRLFAAVVAAVRVVMSETSQTSETGAALKPLENVWYTLDQAAALKGRSTAYLRRKIADGTLSAERDRGWRIRRRDLDAL